MLTPELQNYINQSRAAGITDAQIRQNLITKGWNESDIVLALTLNAPAPVSVKNPKIKKVFVYLVPALWVIALFLPAYIFPGGGSMLGIWCFIWGGVPGTGSIIAWLAWFSNIPFYISYFRFCSSKPIKIFHLILSGLAFIFSLGALTINEMIINEAGGTNPARPSIGAFVWIGSILMLFVGNIVIYRSQKLQTLTINLATPVTPQSSQTSEKNNVGKYILTVFFALSIVLPVIFITIGIVDPIERAISHDIPHSQIFSKLSIKNGLVFESQGPGSYWRAVAVDFNDSYMASYYKQKDEQKRQDSYFHLGQQDLQTVEGLAQKAVIENGGSQDLISDVNFSFTLYTNGKPTLIQTHGLPDSGALRDLYKFFQDKKYYVSNYKIE